MLKLNKRGLWFATDDMQNIILNEEKCFRKGTMSLQKHLVEFQLICQDTIKDATVTIIEVNTVKSQEIPCNRNSFF